MSEDRFTNAIKMLLIMAISFTQTACIVILVNESVSLQARRALSMLYVFIVSYVVYCVIDACTAKCCKSLGASVSSPDSEV